MTGFDLPTWVSVLEKAKFANALDDTTGTSVLGSGVPDDKVYIPLSFVISDTSGAANVINFQKVERDGTITDYHTDFNIAANESRVIAMDEMGPFIPRLEGGTNLQFTADSNGAEITMVYVDNVEV